MGSTKLIKLNNYLVFSDLKKKNHYFTCTVKGGEIGKINKNKENSKINTHVQLTQVIMTHADNHIRGRSCVSTHTY